jgi:inorganic pyrophosphatase
MPRPAEGEHDFWARLASLAAEATLVVDRPKGSAHPEIPALVYPLDYGYLDGFRSGDGDGVDVWVGSMKRRVITGVLCTVDAKNRDAEVKVLLGCTRAEQRRILALHNHGNQRAVLIRPETAKGVSPRRGW